MSNIRYSGSGKLQPLLNQYYATSGNVPSADVLEGMVRGEVQAAYANRNAAQELAMRKKQFDESMKEMKRARQTQMIGNIGALGMFGLANIDKWLPTVKGMFASKEEGGGDKINLPYGSDYGLVNMNEGWNNGATGLSQAPEMTQGQKDELAGTAFGDIHSYPQAPLNQKPTAGKNAFEGAVANVKKGAVIAAPSKRKYLPQPPPELPRYERPASPDEAMAQNRSKFWDKAFYPIDAMKWGINQRRAAIEADRGVAWARKQAASKYMKENPNVPFEKVAEMYKLNEE